MFHDDRHPTEHRSGRLRRARDRCPIGRCELHPNSRGLATEGEVVPLDRAFGDGSGLPHGRRVFGRSMQGKMVLSRRGVGIIFGVGPLVPSTASQSVGPTHLKEPWFFHCRGAKALPSRPVVH